MTEAKQRPEHEHPLAKRLRQAGITKVAIIDDAYDAPTVGIFDGGEIDDFWGKIERDPDMLKELQDFKSDIQDSEDIDDEVINSLWNTRKNLKKLSEPCKKNLFVNRLQMLNDVDAISEHLRTLGLEAITIGSEDELPEQPPIKFIFLDYALDPTDKENLGKMATEKAKEIYSRVEKDAEKPFIVLMSDKLDAEAQQEAFRKDSKLLGGLFGFLPKEDLLNQEKLYINLETLAIDMPARHDIQHFVEALEESVEDASKTFIDRIMELSFEDYANIQWLGLQQDGQPLGDYMLWLYKSYLAHLVHNNDKVLAEQKRLNELYFDKFYPSQNAPSPRLAEIYRYALTEPGIEELGPHPRAVQPSEEPYLHLGDIFINDTKREVLMVINAECDLAFAPEANRDFPHELSILLLPGILQSLYENPKPNLVCTELFNHNSKAYRIAWYHKRAISKKYKDVWSWLSSEGYSRISRLCLPHALEVQHIFAANLTRIGMPIKPPFYRNADVELYGADEYGMCRMLFDEPIQGGASIVNRKIGEDKYEELFSLSTNCRYNLTKALDKAIELLEKQSELLASEEVRDNGKAIVDIEKEKKIRKRINGKIKKIKQMKDPNEVLLQMHLTHHPVPPKPTTHTEPDPKLLWVYRNGNFQGKYNPETPIALNIKFTENPSNSKTPNGDTSGRNEGGPPSESSGMNQKNYGIMKKCRQWIDQNISRVKGWFQNLVCNV